MVYGFGEDGLGLFEDVALYEGVEVPRVFVDLNHHAGNGFVREADGVGVQTGERGGRVGIVEMVDEGGGHYLSAPITKKRCHVSN